MKKILLTTALLCLFVSNASAKWEIGSSFSQFSEEFSDEKFDYNVLSLSLAYQVELSDSWKLTPEIKLGTGIGGYTTDNALYLQGLGSLTNSTLTEATFEIDRYFEIALRVEYFFSPQLYGYLLASNSDFTVSTSARAEDSQLSLPDRGVNDEFGLGIGGGYQISNALSAELSYQKLGFDSMLNVSFKYSF